MRTFLAVLASIALMLLWGLPVLAASPGSSEFHTIFRWTGQDGVVHYADSVPEAVPTEKVEALKVFSDPSVSTGDAGSRTPTSGPREIGRSLPPIEQDLVREGEFALRLLEELNLGSTLSETEAVSRLADRGIIPAHGWLPDFPLTPDTLGQLAASLDEASVSGKISMDRDEARAALENLSASFGLEVAIGSGPGQQPGSEPAYQDAGSSSVQTTIVREYPEPSAVEYYYADYGPPVITYYGPPARYYSLYGWVPYPFWWSGFYFSGYWILNDFHVSHHHHRRHDGGHFGNGHGGHHDRGDYAHREGYGRGGHDNRHAGFSGDDRVGFVSNRVRGSHGRIERVDPSTRRMTGERSVRGRSTYGSSQSINNRSDRQSGSSSLHSLNTGTRTGVRRSGAGGTAVRATAEGRNVSRDRIATKQQVTYERRISSSSDASFNRSFGSSRRGTVVSGPRETARQSFPSSVSRTSFDRSPRIERSGFSGGRSMPGSLRSAFDGRSGGSGSLRTPSWSGGNPSYGRGVSRHGGSRGGFCGRRC